MKDSLLSLEADPSNWELRRALSENLFAEGKQEDAARLIGAAPEIPGDEDSIHFAAKILGTVHPASGLGLIEQFVALYGLSDALEALRVELTEAEAAASEGVSEGVSEDSGDEIDQGSAHVMEVEGMFEVRSFVIGPGAAVQAAERQADTGDKFGAVLIAVVVHVVLILLLGIWTLTSPPPLPPQITVSALAQPTDDPISNETMSEMKQEKSAAAATAQPVISSTSFSDMAVPTNVSAVNDLSMISMPMGDMGFGMSMSGFGDVGNMAGIPAGMRSRCSMSQRMKRLRESGGVDQAETAVRDGLKFLATKQSPETGAFGREYTVGMTGLALLAFLGHCETPESPRFGDSVVRAAMFLMERGLKNDGKLTNGKNGHHEAYEHAIATYALSELFSMTKESGKEIPRLESVIRKAIGIIVDEQTRDGGWPYLGREKEDMSVSGWNIQALKAAHNTGRDFAGVNSALDKAIRKYLPAIQDRDGAFKYNPDHQNGKATLTGAALLGMQIWDGGDDKTFDKGFAYLTEKYKNPSPGADYYAPYYNTQVFFLQGGPEWENYNSKFQPRLLEAQNEDGSWLSNNGPREDHQIMNTAWAILMLEVYYRYLPMTDKVKGLNSR